MKRVISLAILFSMLVSMSACGSSEATEETTASTTASGETTTVAVETEPALPTKDFGGREFNIISFSAKSDSYIDREEQNGDVLNDAIFERNRKIEEDYNIKIVSTVFEQNVTNGAEAVKTSVASNDNSVDLALNNCAQSSQLMLGGYLTELGSVPYVDLSKPWWDKAAVRDLSVGGKSYFAANSLCIFADNLTSVMFFNKDLVEDFKLGDLYELVRDDKWTYPTMYEMSKQVSSDLDGNNVMDDHDRYGILTAAALMTDGIANGGELIFKKNADDYPELSIGSQKSEELAEFFYNLVADTENVLVCNRYTGQYADAWYDLLYPAFMEGRGLFCVGYSQYINYFREMQSDYGVLPRPKFSEEQEQYYSQVNYYWADMINVPVSVADLECCGLILEALASESLETVTPANYEVAMVSKQLRDEESKEMLEIAYSSRIYDFGQFASGLTGLNSEIVSMAQNASGYNFASLVDSRKTSLVEGIEDFIKDFEALE